MDIDNSNTQLKKGTLDFCILLIVAQGEVYSSEILKKLQEADLLVVEGTLYPLLNRLKRAGLLEYRWVESSSGPPRKYYALSEDGEKMLESLRGAWEDLQRSIESLQNQDE